MLLHFFPSPSQDFFGAKHIHIVYGPLSLFRNPIVENVMFQFNLISILETRSLNVMLKYDDNKDYY